MGTAYFRKSEIRSSNPKEIQSLKSEENPRPATQAIDGSCLRISEFGLLSGFGLRLSAFGIQVRGKGADCNHHGTARLFGTVAQMTVASGVAFCKHSPRMTRGWRFILALALALGGIRGAQAQIDSTHRELVQLGYNQPLEG